MDFATSARVIKVDRKLGLVLGRGIEWLVDGAPAFHTQGDPTPEASMLEAAADFMAKGQRVSTEMHTWVDGVPVPDGDVVFAFPLTADIAAALDITTKRTGLL